MSFPDIADLSLKEIGEIKPIRRFAQGAAQLSAYITIANGFPTFYNGFLFYGWVGWLFGGWGPSTWPIGVHILYPGATDPRFANYIAFTIGNAGGVILYQAVNVRLTQLVASVAFALALSFKLEELLEAYWSNVPGRLRTNFDLTTLDYVIAATVGILIASAFAMWNAHRVAASNEVQLESDENQGELIADLGVL